MYDMSCTWMKNHSSVPDPIEGSLIDSWYFFASPSFARHEPRPTGYGAGHQARGRRRPPTPYPRDWYFASRPATNYPPRARMRERTYLSYLAIPPLILNQGLSLSRLYRSIWRWKANVRATSCFRSSPLQGLTRVVRYLTSTTPYRSMRQYVAMHI